MAMSANAQRILKLAHIITACSWLGGNFALLIISFVRLNIDDGRVLLGVNIAGMWVDYIVVIALGALGCLITGLIYSLGTAWGFFKHKWVIAKWILTIAMIVYGISFLGPSKTEMLALNKELLDAVLTSTRYKEVEMMHLLGSPLQIIGLIISVIISIYKPWRKKSIPNN